MPTTTLPARRYPELTAVAIDEARNLIGTPLRRRPHYTVATRDVLLRWAKGGGSRNPLYFDPSYADFYTHWAGQVGHPSALLAFDHTFVAPKLAGIHAIYAGATFEWSRQIRAGDEIRASARLTTVEEKQGSFCGPMVLQTSLVEYRNQHGDLVATATPRIMRTPRDAARERGKYAGLGRHRYTPAEFERIIAAYQSEEFRGSKPRYVEDLRPGDPLPEVVKGPLTTEDMNFFVGEISETLFFREFVAHVRRHPADAYWHEDKGMPDTWDASFLLDKVAQEFGFPVAHDTGVQRVAWLEFLVTNWMSDLALLRRLDVRLTHPFFHADTAWLRGTVTGTEIRDRRAFADLKVWAENQNGILVATGTARVELPSRDFNILQPGLVL